MASVDSRLQPLFTAMNEAGYDWIAAEIIEAIRHGRSRLVSEDVLELTRARIDSSSESPEDIQDDSAPISLTDGDDQISFAVDVITARFKHVSKMIHLSQANLRAIESSGDHSPSGPRLAFLVDEEQRPVTANALQEMSDNIAELAEWLDDWAQSARSGDEQ